MPPQNPGLGSRVTTTTQAGFGNKKKQFNALARAIKPVTGTGQLKNISSAPGK